ncbi:TRAP transporter large permease subunit [Oerskovia turbata]|uniref:TRAP transporter large permease subunit n=1 Tax=Oerskovia turbata TaxID=1713 RepID=A0A4Q1KRU9_9CELL|nr:SLC13 family permease [Oerskovia turbata]RXR27472.1 TRAP transporter large permease subunit [Oerskovia turbata]RXR32300.1 TRAP transporter large permease subunit [Oerskovia turbata]
MSDAAITLTVLGAAVVLFVWNRLPVGVVALAVALSLHLTGVLTVEEALAGFGTPTVILIAALFVVAEALDAAGITVWAGQQLIDRAGTSPARLMVLMLVLSAVLSALVTPNGAVAALFPMVVVLSTRLGRSPSQLLMPLAFGAHAGSLLMLTGTPVNVIVSATALEETGTGLGFFEFALVGVPLLVGTILVCVLWGPRLLPHRSVRSLSRDLAGLPTDLLRDYAPAGSIVRLTVPAGSRLVGVAADAIDTGDRSVHAVAVQDRSGRPSSQVVAGGRLVVRGGRPGIAEFAAAAGLVAPAGPDGEEVACGLVSREHGVAEVIVRPRSGLIGERVFPGMVTDSGELVVLAVQRLGEVLDPVDEGENRPAADPRDQEVTLRAGDALLLQGTWDALDRHTDDPDVLVVDTPDSIRRQAAPLGRRAVPAVVVLVLMVAALATDVLPAAVTAVGAAIAMVLLRVVTTRQAQRSISLTTVILVAGMIPLSTAITQTGAAEIVATALIDVVGSGGLTLLLLGIFVLCAVLGQLISNMATALVMIPVVGSVALELGISPVPLVMCVAVASAAALLTPVATPGNMMVMEPGGYRFGDYWKLGLPVMGVYLVVAVFLVPLIWRP